MEIHEGTQRARGEREITGKGEKERKSEMEGKRKKESEGTRKYILGVVERVGGYGALSFYSHEKTRYSRYSCMTCTIGIFPIDDIAYDNLILLFCVQ